MKPRDVRRVIVDTTVEPKTVMFPTDAKLLNRARERLVGLARKVGLDLRQSYVAPHTLVRPRPFRPLAMSRHCQPRATHSMRPTPP